MSSALLLLQDSVGESEGERVYRNSVRKISLSGTLCVLFIRKELLLSEGWQIVTNFKNRVMETMACDIRLTLTHAYIYFL